MLTEAVHRSIKLILVKSEAGCFHFIFTCIGDNLSRIFCEFCGSAVNTDFYFTLSSFNIATDKADNLTDWDIPVAVYILRKCFSYTKT